MSTPYVRRPVLEGNTDVPVQAQPYLQGTVRKTSAGIIPGFAALVATDAADFVVESDLAGGGPITVVFTPGHSDLLTDIVTTINSYLSGVATASERDGCLRIQTDSSGETVLGVKSFIRVYPATNDYLGTGVPQDCAPLLGFACYPDPAATVTAGDVESAATRPVEQGNPPNTRFVARGEDRTSAAFNRALSQLALNADVTRTAAVREAYFPVNVELDFNSAYAAGWLRFDVNGNTTQIKLSALANLYPQLTGRLYVGGLSNASTLREIAKYWSITDVEGRALSVFDEHYATTRTLRVGAVTRGEQGFGRMYFPDEDSAPTISILDTQYVLADGRNTLGVSRLKQPTTSITEIRGKTNVVCGSLATPAVAPTSTTSPAAGVGFKSHGVAAGDIAVISNATVTSPFCHNGTYYVEDVISEQELILRPISDTDVESLNPRDSGSFGEITIYSSTEWEAEPWITLDPPLPRFPDNKIVLTFGIERETLNQRENVDSSYTDTSAISDNTELTAFQGLQFWQRQSLGGAYAGMSADRTADAGSIVKEQTRPITLVAPTKTPPSAGTYVRGPFSGSLLGNGILAATGGTPPTYDDTFSLGDVGRVVKVTNGALLPLEPYLITEFIDGAHIRLAPLGAEPGAELSSYGSVTYEVYEDVVDYPTPLLTLIAPDEDREGSALADVGILYVREQNNGSAPPFMSTRQHGRSLLHLERVSVGYSSPGTATNIRTVVVTGTTATTVTVGASVESFQNIFAVEGGDTRPVEPPYNGGSVFRIMNGPNAGFYLIQKTTSSNELTLRTLDGDTVLLDTTVPVTQIGAFYNAHISVGHKLAGTAYGDVAYRTAKLRVFFDSLEQGEEAGAGISIDWRGQGAGIVAQLNDPDFVAYDSEAGAIGYLVDATLYSPAHGVNLEVTGAETGETERRSARGLNITAEGHQLKTAPLEWGIEGPEVLTSWGAHIHQAGEDPALIITKGQDIDAEYSHPTDAALQVRLARVPDSSERVYRASGTAIDVTGSVYLRRPFTDTDVTTPGGAFYSETGFSAGQYVVPFQQPYIVPDRDGFSSFDGGLFPTQLGNPDQIYPGGHDDPPATVDLLPPDSALFAFHHIGVVHVVDDASFTTLLNSGGIGCEKFVGTVLEIDDAYATGIVTVTGLLIAGDTIVIGGATLTGTTGIAVVDQFLIDVDPSITAANIAAAINDPANSFTTIVTATSSDAVVTLFAVTAGESGAATTLTVTGSALTASDDTLFSINGAYTVVGIKRDGTAHTADLAVVRYGAFPDWAIPQTDRTMRLFGRRWHQSYISIADFAFLGTWDATATRTELPALTAINYQLNDTQFGLISAATEQFVDFGLLTYLPWSPALDGTSIGYVPRYPYMGDVDNSYTVYASLSKWSSFVGATVRDTHLSEFFYQHPWAKECGESRSPFPNDLLFSNGDYDATTQSYYLATGSTTNSLINDDYAVTFLSGNAQVRWSPQYGGCLQVDCNSTSSSVRIWQRGRTYVMTAHLAVEITVMLAVDGMSVPPEQDTLSIGLCKEDGTIVAEEVILLGNFYDTPRDYTATITLEELYKGSKNVFDATTIEQTLYPFVSLGRTNGGSAFILEIKTDQKTRPAIVSGPQKVAGAQLAHSYRFTDPVRGFQTIGPASADLLCGPEFGSVGGDRIYGTYTGNKYIDHVGNLESSGMVGSFSDSGGKRYQPSSAGRKFYKGMHSAAITLTDGVFDPVFYIYPTTNWGTVDSDSDGIDDAYYDNEIKGAWFLLPGMTGFIMPLDPPHGALLTTLSVNMSFRPFYTHKSDGTRTVDTWGIYARLSSGNAVTETSTPETAEHLLSWDDLEASAGVSVEVWRHNAGSFQTDFPEPYEFSEELPPFGFAERIFQTTLSLTDVAKPDLFVNQVDPTLVPSASGDVYVGTESFVKKTWRLQEEVSSVSYDYQHVLRVDKRQYAYSLVIRFYGGTRQKLTSPLGVEIGAYENYDGVSDPATLGSLLSSAPSYYSGHTELLAYYSGAIMYPGPDNMNDNNTAVFPPTVKFRGARLGWITDRASDGGW